MSDSAAPPIVDPRPTSDEMLSVVAPPLAQRPTVAPRPSEPAAIDPGDAFERRLAREILVSERFRAIFLAVLPTVATLVFLAVSSAYPEGVTWVLQGKFDRLPVGLFLGSVAVFEFYVLHTTERMLRDGTRPSALQRYGYAFIETSLPTLVILYYGTIVGPLQALLMPSPWVYFVFVLLSTLRLDFGLCAFTGLVAAAEYAAVAVVWGSLDSSIAEPGLTSQPQYLAKASVLLFAGIAAGFVAARLRRSFRRVTESYDERARVLQVFGQHVSPEVVEHLVGGEASGEGEQRNVCVMFFDIRDFTAFAENRSPARVVEYLNAVFDAAVEAVHAHGGIVNKFLGDGFMAVFGAPDVLDNPCAAGIDAGLDVLARLDALVAEGKIVPTRAGLGLHAGPAIVGNLGSSRRREYTVIGDVVNVASRVEALNKEIGSRMLVTDAVWDASGKTTALEPAPEHMQVRGRRAAIRVYRLG